MPAGEVVPTTMLELTEAEQSFTFDGLASKPVPSILRDFSAPVILDRAVSTEERAFLLAHDTDPFNKWEAGRALAKDVLTRMVTEDAAPDAAFLDALARVAMDDNLDPAFRALALALPSEDDIAQTLHEAGITPDPTRIHDKRSALRKAMALHMQSQLAGLYDTMRVAGPYSPDAKAAGRRALGGAALGLLTKLDGGAKADAVFQGTDNMTEEFGALANLISTDHGPAAVQIFYDRWSSDRLVMDKWFMVQTARAKPDQALAVAKALEEHPDFNWQNPNRLRALLNGVVHANPAAFHAADGAAYAWFADWIIRVDAINPQVAARSTTFFETWARYDGDRQSLMRDALSRIAATEGLSRDSSEMVSRILGTE